MANPPRTRKRIHAIRRAPDGSAFQKCDQCGVSVAIALSDMHECERTGMNKKFRGNDERLGVHDQPRSPFCFFMESFMRNCKPEEWIEIGRTVFQIWKNMTPKERSPFVIQAEKVDSAYRKILLKEMEVMLGVEDEADSAMVGKFDPDYEDFDGKCYKRFESFDTFDSDMLDTWIA